MEEHVSLSGTIDEKISTCLTAAGWYENRKVDITHVKAFYESVGIKLSAGAEAFLREFYGLAECWYFNKDGKCKDRNGNPSWVSPDFEFRLFPLRGASDDYYTAEASTAELTEEHRKAELFAKEPLVWIGEIGYYYTDNVYIGSTGKLYTAHDGNDTICCYDSLFEMLRQQFKHAAAKWDYVCMRQSYETENGNPSSQPLSPNQN